MSLHCEFSKFSAVTDDTWISMRIWWLLPWNEENIVVQFHSLIFEFIISIGMCVRFSSLSRFNQMNFMFMFVLQLRVSHVLCNRGSRRTVAGWLWIMDAAVGLPRPVIRSSWCPDAKLQLLISERLEPQPHYQVQPSLGGKNIHLTHFTPQLHVSEPLTPPPSVTRFNTNKG